MRSHRRIRATLFAVTAALVALVSTLLTANTANALSGVPVTMYFNQSYCLDADASGLANNGDVVQIYQCSGAANQQWSQTGNPGELINVADGKCLDAPAGGLSGTGDMLQLWDCNGGSQQQWGEYGALYINEPTLITNGGNSQQMAVNSIANGSRVFLWPSNGNAVQTNTWTGLFNGQF